MAIGEDVAVVEMGTVDRISELPKFILHDILSALDMGEAGRASVLSKRWYEAWSSMTVLVFRLRYYNKRYRDCSFKLNFNVSDVEIQSYLGFIDRTMHRYDTQKYRIRVLELELPNEDEKIELLADKWMMIAVQNQVEQLYIKTVRTSSPGILNYMLRGIQNHTLPDIQNYRRSDIQNYRLPEILFRAKSLKVLDCKDIVLPYYETIELTSLEYLILLTETVDVELLQRIISCCPLVEFTTVSDLGNISLPWTSKGNNEAELFGNEIMQSPLREFFYRGLDRDVTWPLNTNVAALKNLKWLAIVRATITDDIVSELVYGLVALESFTFTSCPMLKCVKISSMSLKELRIVEGFGLVKVTIDAPNLIEFWYNCDVKTSLSLIRVSHHCNAQFSPLVKSMTVSLSANWLVKLKEFLLETNFFKSLAVELSQIGLEENQLTNAVTGLPYKLRELKLQETRASGKYVESSLIAVDGLLWCCHPDVLSITTRLQNSDTESLLNFLKDKVKCWKHPLKSVEVEGIDSSNLLSKASEIEFRFRLSWFKV